MSGKRPSLADSMKLAAQPDPVALPIARPAPAAEAIPQPVPPLPTAKAAGFYAATRAGKKKVTATLDPATHKRLKSMAVARETTTEALLQEAIADLFAKHGNG